MGERTSYAPGTFCWVELATTDGAAAKEFYGGLFGWESQNLAGPHDMLTLSGKEVGAMYEQREEHQAEAPPSWMSYVSVEDVDATAEKARHLGATVVAGPFDAMEAGRMAVLVDPEGAAFALWQPREHIGAALVNEAGALSLNQLNTNGPEAAQSFYSDLFGWSYESTGAGEQAYWEISNGESLNGTMVLLAPGTPAPPHWLAYFTSEDLDASTARIEELGGQMLVPITPIAVGRIAVAQDPQGAAFALFEGRVDP